MRGQYIGTHKETGIEVQVTFPVGLDEEKAKQVANLCEAFTHFLGQIESQEPRNQKLLSEFIAGFLKQVDDMSKELRENGQVNYLVSAIDASKGGSTGRYNFSKN